MILISYIAQLCITLYTYLRNKRSGNPPTEVNLEARIDESSLTPCLRSESPELPIGFKLSKEQLSTCKKLCQGRYGTVMEAQLSNNGTRQKVAVRVIKGSGGDKLLKAALEMVHTMAYLGQHLNLVNILGAVTKGLRNGELLVVAEYCQHGTLLNFLRRNKRNFIEQLGSNPHSTWADDGASSSSTRPSGKIITYIDLMSWSFQIASAMSFLESYNVVHGHLALENVLMYDKKVVKLDKVGLLPAMVAGHSYVGMGEDFYPYKWLALECFSEREFTTKSDVWSFGVLLWELFTLGETPYAAMPNKDLYRRLDEGFRLELPDNAFPEIHDMMRMCWYIRPYLRPTFQKLEEGLSAMLPKEITNVSDAHTVANNN
ncbi:platelet-derived growth factor receptor beta-like [Anopheles ziemanni]|uniref:platelet-derived growth factor receptor beta-like n=1 Tax=Anopheles coustani TaxID=139045 RepID=UPI00265B324E|nr:platelet-derived growth factor receptor beta-like [Anopheles coustani]XP_058178209.1 platelet-derived growth factor receptor beta-like [Anopheles ziemanni]